MYDYVFTYHLTLHLIYSSNSYPQPNWISIHSCINERDKGYLAADLALTIVNLSFQLPYALPGLWGDRFNLKTITQNQVV